MAMFKNPSPAAAIICLVICAFFKFGSTSEESGDDLVISYKGNNVSIISILQRLNITGNFRFGAFCPRDEHSCQTRCIKGAVGGLTERQQNLPCYCDSHCLDVGDCCYDFFSSCSQVKQSHDSRRGQWQCVNMNSLGSQGHVMKTKCPEATVEPEIQTLCEIVDDTDFLRGMPVVDEQTGVVYRNVFCARCNSVQRVSYWRMTADCGRIPASALPQDNALLLAFIRENCTVNYKPTDAQQLYLKNCLAAESICSSKQIVEEEPVLQDLCSYYAFPVCGDTNLKNPHCSLCRGDDITQFNCRCTMTVTDYPPTYVTSPGSTTLPDITAPEWTTPPDIMSRHEPTTPQHVTTPGSATPKETTTPESRTPPHTSTPGTTGPPHTGTPGTTHPPYSTTPGWTSPPASTTPGWSTPPQTTRPDTKPQPMTTVVTIKPLVIQQHPPPPPLNILFDFSSNKIIIQSKTTKTKILEQKTCQEGFVYDPFVKKCREAFRKEVINTNRLIYSTNKTSGIVLTLNCSSVQLNSSEIVLYPNGTLWVPLYASEYNRTDYFINGSYVFLCTNFAGNYSKKENIATWSYVISTLQILTYAGGSVSILSLLILLVIYCIFKELRTLPGKNLINLSFTMIFYHLFLFVAGLRNIEELCIGIAILLHYFLLCSFAWMSVMAFDVVKTFAFHDHNARSQQTRNRRKTLMKYCVCAWGVPAIAVLACVTLDYTDTVKIGYGLGGFCWIKNGTASLAVVGAPIALVILFNFIALTWTIISIYKVRKVTNKLTDQGGRSSLALLYIKLTFVLGITWVFGFLSSIVKTDATAYLFALGGGAGRGEREVVVKRDSCTQAIVEP